jgi:hypothetical protein
MVEKPRIQQKRFVNKDKIQNGHHSCQLISWYAIYSLRKTHENLKKLSINITEIPKIPFKCTSNIKIHQNLV